MKHTLDIAHHTEKHNEILKRCEEYVRVSLEARSPDFARFALHDRVADGYISVPADEIEQQQNTSRPVFQTIVLPQSYASMMSILTYVGTVFLSRTPIIQLLGQTAEAQVNELAVESFLQYQLRNSGSIPVLFQQLRDSLQYGQGITGIAWEEDTDAIAALAVEQDIDTGKKQKRLLEKDVTSFIGNKSYSVRPPDFVHDPTVSLAQFHEGEFAGEFKTIPRSKILKGFETGEYIRANKKRFEESTKLAGYLSKYWAQGGGDGNPEHALANKYDYSLNNFYITRQRGKSGVDRPYFCEVLDLYVKIIPKEWNLADSTRESIWLFRIANGQILLQVRPLQLLHNTFPYDVAPGDIDLYRLSPVSVIERAIPFEHTMNWLLNSHFYSVRQHLSNTMLVDPSRVMMMDLFNRSPSGVIRAKPEAYGQDLRQALHQLQLADVTGQHLKDLQMIDVQGQQVLGVNDNVLGQVHPGGRKTATEIRTSTSFATNRLKFYAEWLSAVTYARKTRIMLLNSQQFFDGEMMIRKFGMDRNDTEAFTKLTPEVIAGNFLYEPVDGTLPMDRIGQAQTFGQLMMQMMQQDPTLDGSAMMQFLASLMGFRALPAFRRMQVVPDEQFAQQQQAGNTATPPGAQVDPAAMPQGPQ